MSVNVDAAAGVVGDAAAIRAIYNHEVTTATSTFDLVPRSLDDQEHWLAARSGRLLGDRRVDDDDRCVGFGSLSPYKDRAAYRTHGRGLGLRRPPAQRPGRRHAAARPARRDRRVSGFHAVMARIEASGAASRALHAKCGFELVGIERQVGRKFNRWLDVAVMQRLL